MRFQKFSGKYASPDFKPKDIVGMPSTVYTRVTPVYPSRNSADTATGAALATRRDIPRYTGTAMLGVATMHKSNSVPVFSQEAAIETATMRRN